MPRRQRDPELEQLWRRHVAQQEISGLSVRRYCHLHGLKEPSFYSWRTILRERDRLAPTKQSVTPAFLPVAVVDPPVAPVEPPLEIHLDGLGGRRSLRIRNGCDRRLLADVLALLQNPALEAPSC
jgi:transposase-like protein